MVEIIPKPAPEVPLWLSVLLYFSVGLFLVSLLLLFFLFRFEKEASSTLQGLEVIIAQEKDARDSLEKEVFEKQDKIDDFAKLWQRHYYPLNFFTVLEKLSHPQIQFTEINLNINETKVGFSGQSETFEALAQQIFIFKKSEEIRDVYLSKISLGKFGGANFAISLVLEPKIFK